MTAVIRVEDVEEFKLVIRLPRAAISADVLTGIKQLNEKTQIEPFIREIIPDPTDTAHGSTEIADVLTTHLTYGNRPRHAAFVNKGKSTPKVTSKIVGYQLLELRQLDGVDLMVLLAVGEIQDDIKRDLITVAQDANADYMIVDAVDVARLFIAYQKVCPNDGSAFESGRCPNCGRSADEPVELTIKLYEDFRYSLLDHKDVSHAGAKRYRANVLTDPHYSKPAIREVVKLATWELRQSDYYRNDLTEARFGKSDADCVFLFVYPDLSDLQQTNWICRAQWISPDLPEEFKPSEWPASERIGDIALDWNDGYESRRQLFNHESKQQWAKRVESLLPTIEEQIDRARALYAAWQGGSATEAEFSDQMQKLEARALTVSRQAGSGELPPVECEEADQAFQGVVTMFHNVFVPFASWSKVRRDARFKTWHVETYLRYFDDELQGFRHEWRKVR